MLIANLAEMLNERGGWKALDTTGIRDLVHAATMAGRLAARTDSTLRLARLRAEHEAVRAVAPDAERRLRSLDLQLRLQALEVYAARTRSLAGPVEVST